LLEGGGGGQAGEGVAVQGVVGPGAALLAVQQPGLDECFEVVADGRLAEAERAGELADADRVGAGGQQVDDLDPVGVDICRCIRPAPLPPLAAKLWINLC
jgi:hypothetical protein